MQYLSSKRKSIQISEHAITLAGEELQYTLRRSSRRTLGLTVGPGGLKVAAPLRVPQHEVLSFIHLHANWIVDKLTHWQQQEQQPQIQLNDGARFVFLGQPCLLRLIDLSEQEGVVSSESAENTYEIRLRNYSERKKIWLAFWRVTETYALTHFKARVSYYCAQIFRPIPTLRLSNALTRWGSCSNRSGIRLSWRLMFLTTAEAEYVIAHEVAHLVEMNHSARFWAVVASLFPDYQSAETSLNTANKRVPEFAP